MSYRNLNKFGLEIRKERGWADPVLVVKGIIIEAD